MKGKIFALAIVVLMAFGSFGAVGTNSETELENDCDCGNNSSTLSERPCGLIKPDNWPEGAPLGDIQPMFYLPESFDWRTEANGLPPCKDQGWCGSCWAFATAGPLECNIKIEDGEIVDLSEQWLLSCNDDGYDCGGGFYVYDMYKDDGAVMEDDFKYQGNDGISCGTDGPYNHVYKIDDFEYISYGIASDEDMKQAILEYGPIGACIYCDSIGWQWHSLWNPNGIYTTDSSEPTNHIITIVGWNVNEGSSDPGYWIVRNSWGTGFCDNGYIKIKYGICSIGDFASYVVYPGCDLYKKTKNGDDFYWSEGDVITGNDYARLSAGFFDPGKVAYEIHIDDYQNVIELWIGIQYKDIGTIGDGPDMYAQKDDGSWEKLEGQMSGPDTYTYTWRRFTSFSDYIDSSGNVRIKVVADANDDTYIRRAGVKYEYRVPEPNLDCEGSISASQIKPGDRVTGSFKVKNIGESGSELDWKVSDWPDWGSTWSFNPTSGSGLASGSSKTVEVSFYAPSVQEQDFSGKIKVVNLDDSTDYDTVSVSVSTPRSRDRTLFYSILELLQARFPFLFKFFSF